MKNFSLMLNIENYRILSVFRPDKVSPKFLELHLLSPRFKSVVWDDRNDQTVHHFQSSLTDVAQIRSSRTSTLSVLHN